jgi:hypothetical protein
MSIGKGEIGLHSQVNGPLQLGGASGRQLGGHE